MRGEAVVELRLEHLEHGQAALDAVHGARELVGLVAVDDPWGLRVEHHPARHQPLDHRRCVLDDQADQVGPAGAAADPGDVREVASGLSSMPRAR